jgi:hypothetical protein
MDSNPWATMSDVPAALGGVVLMATLADCVEVTWAALAGGRAVAGHRGPETA